MSDEELSYEEESISYDEKSLLSDEGYFICLWYGRCFSKVSDFIRDHAYILFKSLLILCLYIFDLTGLVLAIYFGDPAYVAFFAVVSCTEFVLFTLRFFTETSLIDISKYRPYFRETLSNPKICQIVLFSEMTLTLFACVLIGLPIRVEPLSETVPALVEYQIENSLLSNKTNALPEGLHSWSINSLDIIVMTLLGIIKVIQFIILLPMMSFYGEYNRILRKRRIPKNF